MGLFDGGESQGTIFGDLEGIDNVSLDWSSDPAYIASSVDPIVAAFGEEGIIPGQPIIPAGSSGANVVVDSTSPNFLASLSGLITGVLPKLFSSSQPTSGAGIQATTKPTTSIFGSLGQQGSNLIPIILIGLVVMVIIFGKKVFK